MTQEQLIRRKYERLNNTISVLLGVLIITAFIGWCVSHDVSKALELIGDLL